MRDFQQPGKSPTFSQNGMCATSHPLAAQVAIQILVNGGNAMDAAIAGAVLLGICEPQSTGIGGDCFVLWKRPNCTKIRALNGSGRAPKAISASLLRDAGEKVVPVYSPHAITIPGAIDAFCHLAENEGRLGLDTLLAPSIYYADNGVPVAPRVAFDWASSAGSLHRSSKLAYLVNGRVPKPGDIFIIPEQAEVLRRVAKYGRDGFYCGEVADDMVTSLRNLGGSHTHDDFFYNSSTPTDPILGHYGNTTFFEHPPNGQGATAILLLNILKHFELTHLDPFDAERIHIEAEATKLAYDARNRFVSDQDYTERLEHMLSHETASRLAELINPQCAINLPSAVCEAVHKDTVYITVVDRDRMAVSMIYSIFHGFGSGMASDKFKILFQNRGAGFTLKEGHPNELAPGKRPMHTIIPAFLQIEDQSIIPFGVMGGAYQPNGHARLISNLIDFELDLQLAIDAPRSFTDEGNLLVERGYSEKVKKKLVNLGHKILVPKIPIGGAQAIKIHTSGILEGASDPRKDGCALGY
ncbi:MAG: gamma-glutamyltransferase family protein [Aestuariivita sp.]|nr:gamma-glutamyltransferase family protein [Aestuariivita sp.]